MQGVLSQSGSHHMIQSVKRWQKSYFYVKNVAPQGDYVNLPAYVAGPPAGRRP